MAKTMKRVLTAASALVLALGCMTALKTTTVKADGGIAGSYEGTYASESAMGTTTYTYHMTLSTDGAYTCEVAYAMMGETYTEQESGTWTSDGSAVAVTGISTVVSAMDTTAALSDLSGTAEGGSITLTRPSSYMAASMGKDPVAVTFTQSESFDPPADEPGTDEPAAAHTVTYTDEVNSSDVIFTVATVVFDEAGEPQQQILMSGDTLPAGQMLAVRVVNDSDKRVVLYTDSAPIDIEPGGADGVMYMEGITADISFALKYAQEEAPIDVPKDTALASGTYVLTEDSYDPSAMMKLAADVKIDAAAGTVEVWRTMASGEYSRRSAGTFTKDEATGVYTISFSEPEGKTTTFVCSGDSITFTSPLWFGAVAMNTTDDAGNFLTYTAKLGASGTTPSDNKNDGTGTATKPGTTTKPGTGTAAGRSPKTGSENNAALWMMLGLACAGAAVLAAKKKTR